MTLQQARSNYRKAETSLRRLFRFISCNCTELETAAIRLIKNAVILGRIERKLGLQ